MWCRAGGIPSICRVKQQSPALLPPPCAACPCSSSCMVSRLATSSPRPRVVGWRRQGNVGVRGENTSSRIWLGGGWRLSYGSESRSIFSFSSLSGTLPLLQGWEAELNCTAHLGAPGALPTTSRHTPITGGGCYLAYGSPLAQYPLAPTHTESWHGLLKDPALYFVARGKL